MSKANYANSNTLLHYAVVHSDDVNEIKKILNSYSDLNERKKLLLAKNDSGSTALKLAVEHNRYKATKYLLELFSFFSDFEHDSLILKLAVKKNFLKIVKLLLENGWLIETRGERETVLHIAAEQNNVSLVEYLLEKGANVEAKNAEGYTLVLSAAAHNSLEVVEIFHKLKLLTHFSSYGETILSVAIKNNAVNVINYLIMICRHEKELVPLIFHRPNNDMDTPLHIAAGMGNIDTFNKILNFYEDINPFNTNQETPLHFAVKYNHFKIVKRILEISTFSVNLLSASGTPLFSAVYCKSYDIVDLLIKNGADKSLTFNERKALLKTALLLKNIKVFKLLISSLISSKEDPNMIIELRQLCLKLAIKKHLTEIVEYLLDVSDWKDVMRRKPPQKETTSPIQHLIKYMPEMAMKIFDRCVETDEKHVYYYYEFIDDIYYIPNKANVLEPDELCVYDSQKNKLKPDAKERNEEYYTILDDHPLSLMLKNHRHDLLSHKLVESYINSKWNRFIKWQYYSTCFYHLAFVLFLTMVIFTISPAKHILSTHHNDCSLLAYERILFFLFFMTHLLYTFYKLWRYFNLFRCLADSVIIVLTFVIFYKNCLLSSPAQNVLFVLYLCVCLCLANMVKKLPRFGVYVLLIFHTLKSFLRFSPVFMMFLMPFVVIFYALLNENRELASFFHTLIRTLVMMVGELEYQDSIASKATPITNIFFCLFLIIVTIFLMNLLIGLAVSDTSAMLEKASRMRIKLQIETIHRIEIDMPQFLRRYFWRGFSKRNKHDEDEQSAITNFRQLFRWFGLSKEVLKKQKLLYEPLNQIPTFDDESKPFSSKDSETFVKLIKQQKEIIHAIKNMEQKFDYIMLQKEQNLSIPFIDESSSK